MSEEIMNHQTTYASEWKQKLLEKAAVKEEPLTAEVEVAGFRFIGKRLSLFKWIRSGRLPEALLGMVVAGEGIKPEELSFDELKRSLQFQRQAICEAIIEPRIVLHDQPAEDEISYMHLCEHTPEVVDALMAWIFQGQPGIPIKTKEGNVSADALNQFRQKVPGGTPLRDRVDGEQVRQEAERSLGD